jgi:PHP family Zn ribbon phosphoesterase
MPDSQKEREDVNWSCPKCGWEFKLTVPNRSTSISDWAHEMRKECIKEFARHVCEKES